MKKIILIGFALGLSACSHTLDFRSSHFAVPVTGQEQWDGHVAFVGVSNTEITIVNDVSSNPPLRDDLRINDDPDAKDFLLLNNMGLDASLSVLSSVDVTLDNTLLGLRWQFLNHSAQKDVWVAAIQGAIGQKNSETSKTSGSVESSANSDIDTRQLGVSVGYKMEHLVPYMSYIYETHDVSTKIKNSHGDFGPYDDKGTHKYISLGVTSHGKGLVYAAEYSRIDIKWDRSETKYQDAIALKLGYAW